MAKELHQELRVITDNGRPAVIYPVKERHRYSHLLTLAGYSERLAREGEADKHPHLVHASNVGRKNRGGGHGAACPFR